MKSKSSKLKRIIKITGGGTFVFLFFFIVMDLLFPFNPDIKYSVEVHDNKGNLLNAYITKDDKWRLETKLREVNRELITAIINKEDRWFYYHPGVNIGAVARAFFQNVTTGERVSGASTITMQLARMLRPAERTYYNKLVEIIHALQLELHYSKDEILEMYLSVLPYGGNIEGVKSASFIYFNRHPRNLSLSQAVLLAVIPNDPNRYRPDKNNDNVKTKRDIWLNKFRQNSLFENNTVDAALLEPITTQRYSMPDYAPHFSRFVKESNLETYINTTLDFELQKKSETLLKKYVERNRNKNVSNGAVIVINNKTGAVLSYCGSADFYDKVNSGEVDGIQAVRSPGSTLKPFVYGMAFDILGYTPKLKVMDLPIDIGGYSPVNFDNTFRGWVTLDFALLNSLNIPAVEITNDLGYESVVNFFEEVGFKTIARDKEKLGLSVILGGCGVTLYELVEAYSMFSNGGKKVSINYLQEGEAKFSGERMLSAGACFLVSDILRNENRPDIASDLIFNSPIPKFSWKTGTSYGKRDAWAVGFNDKYTVGVWIGNFDGTGSPYVSGAKMAVPLLFEIYSNLDYEGSVLRQPKNVKKRSVCLHSGKVLSDLCKNSINDFYIVQKSANTVCELEKEIYLNKDKSIQFCKECIPNGEYIKDTVFNYPARLVLWNKTNNGITYSQPPHNPECEQLLSDNSLEVISPQENYKYYMTAEKNESILLHAASNEKIPYQYWYVNGTFVGKVKNGGKLFYKPTAEYNEIICIDDSGNKKELTIEISFY